MVHPHNITGELIRESAVVGSREAGLRFDQAAAALFPDFSRSRLKNWISDGALTLDGQVQKPRVAVEQGQQLVLKAALEPDTSHDPEPIPLSLVHQDESVLVINKPAGLVVHPAAGNRHGTLQNALLHFDASLAGIPRAGIVHRLDKDTTGLMVVARTPPAHKSLVSQLQARTVKREYAGVAWGAMVAGGTVDQPIGRHPKDRKKMAVVTNGKPAVTHYRVAERMRDFTVLRLNLETGRTHQIRVHMAWLRHPLVGDPVYGGRRRQPAGATEALIAALNAFQRQALHARVLSFEHPGSGDQVSFEAPIAEDMRRLIAALRAS